MMTIEEQVLNKVLQVVSTFLKDNLDQKITTWNGPALIGVLKNEMNNVIKEYDGKREEAKKKIIEEEVIKDSQ